MSALIKNFLKEAWSNIPSFVKTYFIINIPLHVTENLFTYDGLTFLGRRLFNVKILSGSNVNEAGLKRFS